MAEIQRVETRAAALQPRAHFRVGRLDEAGLDDPACDAGLIGDDDERVTGALEQAQRVAGPGEQLELFDAMEITDIDVHGAVTVEKDGSGHSE